jgi:type VI secretion system FHA domain protein
MVLLMRAVSFKGRPVAPELSARFEESGGTIGRGQNNALVLADPERYISRIHATVSFQAGGFIITDNGTKNPVLLNGRPLGQGNQAKLADGDTVKVGDYILQVSLPRGAPQQAAPPPPKVARDDPFAGLERHGSKGPDPFADLIPPERAASPPPREPVAWPGPPAKERAPVGSDPLAGLRPPEPHIDEILGLKTPAPDPLAPGPSPGASPSERAPLLPDDPFADWPQIKANRPPVVPDHTPELKLPFFPPEARPDPALSPKIEVPGAAAPVVPLPAPTPPPVLMPPAGVTPAPPAQPAPASAGPAPDELLRAFLRGSAIPEAKIAGGLTPEMMESVGRLIHEAVKGTVDLLRARATTKGEMRADVTMIMPMDNNPLKFSPSAEAALVHLLAPSVPGFSSPLRAMKEAYDDLRAHQLGFLAGMRAALDEVLTRFEPDGLEQRLSEPGLLASLLPANRKAKLWDLFVERYADVAADAREDFHAAFGKAFLRAYNEQVKRLRAEDRRG